MRGAKESRTRTTCLHLFIALSWYVHRGPTGHAEATRAIRIVYIHVFDA